MNSYIAIVSGGMDSGTLLFQLAKEGHQVKALSFDYGQRHKVELGYAARLCKRLEVEHHIVDLSSLTPLLAGSALTNPEVAVPEGHYADESMKQTVVPNRNAIMLSIAI